MAHTSETRGHITVQSTERYGRTDYPVWYSTRITRVTFDDGHARADVMAFRSTTKPVGSYLGDVAGHFSEPWQRYMDTQHVQALEVERVQAHERALRDHAADKNAQRCYRVATMQDLRTWLSPVPNCHPILDTWTVQRRVDLMRRALAVKEAELCMSADHDRFSDATVSGTASHVAAHLAKLRGQQVTS
jgi:hypothetical protein